MDPISTALSVISVLQVALQTTSILVQYASDVKGASSERAALAGEAAALHDLLRRVLETTQQNATDKAWLECRKRVIQQFEITHNELVTMLKFDISTGKLMPESRLRMVYAAAKWSFNKSEIYALLERVARLQQYANTLLIADQSDLLKIMDQRQQEVCERELKAALFSWLSPINMSAIHQSIVQRAEKGSGSWLLNSKQYMSWESGVIDSLWCYGMPGAGKTIIASIIADHLHAKITKSPATKLIGVAVVYLRYHDAEQSLINILGSILKQIGQHEQITATKLQAFIQDTKDLDRAPRLEDTMSAISSCIDLYSEVYLIVDAFDETTDEIRWGILENLRVFRPKARLLITSRYSGNISEDLEDFATLEIRANKADVELFIDSEIERNHHLKRVVHKSQSLRGDIKEAVVRTASDMFLLAQLHLASLASAAALSIRHVRNKIKTLPTTIYGTYDEAINRIKSQDHDHRAIALDAIGWVSHAFRPLSSNELQHALAVKPGEPWLDVDAIMDLNSITALCAGLLVVDEVADTVNLVHYTAQSYFEDNHEVYFHGFHGDITMRCATYLILPELQNISLRNVVSNNHLACYAAQYLGDHARRNPEEALEPSILNAVCQLLTDPIKRAPLLNLLDGLDLTRSGSLALQDQLDSPKPDTPRKVISSPVKADTKASETFGRRNDMIIEVTALHLAASMGLAKVASMLLKDTNNIDALDETGKTALSVAIERGFENAVELLVNSGASVDLNAVHGQRILLLITEKGWYAVGDIIIQRSKALYEGDHKIVFLCYINSGDVHHAKEFFSSTEFNALDRASKELGLFLAVERSDVKMVRLLLSFGVDVNAKDDVGQTSLHRATRRQDIDVMKLLLEQGAEVDSRNDDWRTPWSANVQTRNEESLGLLLKAGADPNTKGAEGTSALFFAAANGETDTVRFMLKSGTNPSLLTNYGWAPLHWAAANGHIECVRLLIEAKADLNPISDQGTTPLVHARNRNQTAIVDMLLLAGAREGPESPFAIISKEDDGHESHVESLEEAFTTLKVVSPQKIDNSVVSSQSKVVLGFDRPLHLSCQFGQFVYDLNYHHSDASDSHDFTRAELKPYQISHLLNSAEQSICVRRAQRRPKMSAYPLDADSFPLQDILYNIKRMRADYQELELRGSNPGMQHAAAEIVTMRRTWSGSWKAYKKAIEGSPVLLFRTTPDWTHSGEDQSRWTTDDGTLVARTQGEKESSLVMESGLDSKTQDLLVVCWIAKRWYSTLTKQ